jgi:DNA (cytosine-5)-methyltransferase 1
VRELLQEIGLPYVIENVPGAPLINPVTLCGSQFGLTTLWQNSIYGLRRHRAFEFYGFTLPDAGQHDHSLLSIGVYGNGAGGGRPRNVKGPGFENARREVMRIDWMRREELNESIPPAYTEYVGRYLLAAIKAKQGYVLAA